jgi:hypothetical protein
VRLSLCHKFLLVTIILNILLIFLLILLAVLLILWRRKPAKPILLRWSLFTGLLFILTAVFRLIPDKEEHAATKPANLSLQQHNQYSQAFTHSLDKITVSCFAVSDELAAGNTTGAEKQGERLKQALDSFNIEEIVADTVKYDTVYLSLDNARAETISIVADPDLAEKRASLNILSRELVAILTLLDIPGSTYYRLICPDAFGKGHEGWWIGKTAEALNPYGLTGCSLAERIVKAEQPIIK